VLLFWINEELPQTWQNPGYSLRMLLGKVFRLKQLPKNALVFLLPLSDGQIIGTNFNFRAIVESFFAFIAVSLISSGNYLVNDIHDAEEDRAHPAKKFRPIPSGALSIPAGYLISAFCFLSGFGLTFLSLGRNASFFLLVFAVLQFLYTQIFRSIHGTDIIVIAGLFFLRACFPYAYLNVQTSPWFVVLIIFCALAIISGKRLAELRNGHTRSVLNFYSETQLQLLVGSFWTLTIAGYASWLQNQELNFDLRWGLVSLFPFIAIFIRLLPKMLDAKSETPEELLLTDKGNLILGFLWLITYLLAKNLL
jgi:decaprenyl-phosphate phosphoribosyltransferase